MAKFTLRKPVVVDGKEITTLEVEEPSVKGLAIYERKLKDGATDSEATIAMLAHELDLPVHAIEKFKVGDMNAIAAIYEPFKGAPPAAGAAGASSSQTAPIT